MERELNVFIATEGTTYPTQNLRVKAEKGGKLFIIVPFLRKVRIIMSIVTNSVGHWLSPIQSYFDFKYCF